jgi:hypothetical protein
MALAEAELNLPTGTMKATVLIETLPAVFQMDEILHALRDRIVGLNCGRWDYIFSYLKTLRGHRDRLLPERGQVVDDGAVPEGLFGVADQDLPSPRRVRHGRHGGADSDQGRRCRQRGRDGPRCAPTSCAK